MKKSWFSKKFRAHGRANFQFKKNYCFKQGSQLRSILIKCKCGIHILVEMDPASILCARIFSEIKKLDFIKQIDYIELALNDI
ncbi:hypothetical protein LEP1GSC072_2930 [Leptospira noguchii str. Bonito]|nr:hypothetical protein LEP1GSC072_2930 [Leptospira noguchii str. Bonito]